MGHLILNDSQLILHFEDYASLVRDTFWILGIDLIVIVPIVHISVNVLQLLVEGTLKSSLRVAYE